MNTCQCESENHEHGCNASATEGIRTEYGRFEVCEACAEHYVRDGYATREASAPNHSIARKGAYSALRRMDDLGFETTEQAACAILDHADWRERWEIDAEYVEIIREWRKETLRASLKNKA